MAALAPHLPAARVPLEVNVGLRGNGEAGFYLAPRAWIDAAMLAQRLPSLSLLIAEFRAKNSDTLHLRYLGIFDFDAWDDALLESFRSGKTPLRLFRGAGEEGDEILDAASLPKDLAAHLVRLIGARARARKFGARELIAHVPLLGKLWRRVSLVCERLRDAGLAFDVYFSGGALASARWRYRLCHATHQHHTLASNRSGKGFRVLVRAPELFCAVVPGESKYGAAAVAVVERFLIAKGCTAADVANLIDKSPFGPNKGTKPDVLAHPTSRLWPQLVDIDAVVAGGARASASLAAEDKALTPRIVAFARWLVAAARAAWPTLGTLQCVRGEAAAPAADARRAPPAPAKKKARVSPPAEANGGAPAPPAAAPPSKISEPLYDFPKAPRGGLLVATHFVLNGDMTSYRHVDAAQLPRLYALLAASTTPNSSNERFSDVSRLVVDYDGGPPLREPCAALGGATPLAAMQRILLSSAIFSLPPCAAELDCVVIVTPSRPTDAAGTQRAKIYWRDVFVVCDDGAAALVALAVQLAAFDPDVAAGYAESSDDDAVAANDDDDIMVADEDADDAMAGVEAPARDAAASIGASGAASKDGCRRAESKSDSDSDSDGNSDSDSGDAIGPARAAAIDWRSIIDPHIYVSRGVRMPLADLFDATRGCYEGRAHRFDPLCEIEFDAAGRPVPPERRRCQTALKLLYATSLREESALHAGDAAHAHAGWMPRELAPAAAAHRPAPRAAVLDAAVLAAELRDAVAAELRADERMAPLFAGGGALRVAKRFNGRVYIDSTQRGCPNAPERDGVRAHTSRTLFVVLEPVNGGALPSLRCRCGKERVGALGTTCAQLRVVGAPLSVGLARRVFARLAAVTLDEVHAPLPLANVRAFANQQQLGEAKMLHALMRERIVFDAAEKGFYTFCGSHWVADTTGLVMHVACNILWAQYTAAAAALAKKERAHARTDAAGNAAADAADEPAARAKAKKPKEAEKPKEAKEAKKAPTASVVMNKYATRVAASAHIAGVLRLAAPLFTIDNSRWDADPYTLHCTNGAVSLRTGAFRPTEPSDHNRIVCASAFGGLDAPAPLFAAALQRVFHVDACGLAREAARDMIAGTLAPAHFVERMQQLGANVSGDEKACARAAETLVEAAGAASLPDPGLARGEGDSESDDSDSDGDEPNEAVGGGPAAVGALAAFEAAFTAAVPAQPGALELAFVQELFGASLLGEVQIQQLAVHVGPRGSNGKSMLFETIGDALGRAVARPVPVEALLVANQAGAGPSPYVASLRGLRMGWSSEPDSGARLSSSQIRLLCGGDSVTARHLYGHPVTFTPSHTLHLVTNHLLAAPGDDEAFWRRIVVVQYHNRFVERPTRADEHPKMPDLRRRILAEEAPGVLAWLVAGCVRFLERDSRFDVPPSARAVTQRYEHSQSNVVQFAAEMCTLAPAVRTSAAALRNAYVAWAAEAKRAPLSQQVFSARVCELDGVSRRRTSTGFVYEGIALRK
jgi:P4 family phage/plasmid primase-like protien